MTRVSCYTQHCPNIHISSDRHTHFPLATQQSTQAHTITVTQTYHTNSHNSTEAQSGLDNPKDVKFWAHTQPWWYTHTIPPSQTHCRHNHSDATTQCYTVAYNDSTSTNISANAQQHSNVYPIPLSHKHNHRDIHHLIYAHQEVAQNSTWTQTHTQAQGASVKTNDAYWPWSKSQQNRNKLYHPDHIVWLWCNELRTESGQ